MMLFMVVAMAESLPVEGVRGSLGLAGGASRARRGERGPKLGDAFSLSASCFFRYKFKGRFTLLRPPRRVFGVFFRTGRERGRADNIII